MIETSQAVVFTSVDQPLSLQTVPLPALRSGEALVRVTCCTLCGSDLHTYQGHRSTPAPTVLGHEIIGRIEAVGPDGELRDVEGRPLQVGDRVTWSIAAHCGSCFFCEHDIPQKCERLFKYGHERLTDAHPLSGGLAEHCHLAAGTTIIRIPDELADEVACPANCATATVAGALRVGGDCSDEVVLIQGAGMLGLTACAMARTRGAREVIVCDVDASRVTLAERFGATHCLTIGDDEQELTDIVNQTTSGRGVDLAIELCGAPSAVEMGLPCLRIGGRYVLVGAVFPSRPFSASPEMIVRRLLNIQGLHNYTPQDLATAVDFLAHHHDCFPLAELVTDTFPLSESENAFQHAISTGALRVAVRP